MSHLQSRVIPGRSCGSCSLCCKVFAVPDFAKPRSVLCSHCVPGAGCAIHESRPTICRDFFCNWLLIEALGPEWKPDRCGFVLQSVAQPGGHQGLVIHVDPDRPGSWRQAPYHAQIRRWAAKAAAQTGPTGPIYFVMAVVDHDFHLVLPEQDVRLGAASGDEVFEVSREIADSRVRLTARKVSLGADRIAVPAVYVGLDSA